MVKEKTMLDHFYQKRILIRLILTLCLLQYHFLDIRALAEEGDQVQNVDYASEAERIIQDAQDRFAKANLEKDKIKSFYDHAEERFRPVKEEFDKVEKEYQEARKKDSGELERLRKEIDRAKTEYATTPNDETKADLAKAEEAMKTYLDYQKGSGEGASALIDKYKEYEKKKELYDKAKDERDSAKAKLAKAEENLERAKESWDKARKLKEVAEKIADTPDGEQKKQLVDKFNELASGVQEARIDPEIPQPLDPKKDKQFKGNELKIAISLAIGALLIGTISGGCRPIHADMMVAGAGAVTYIASEIMVNKKNKEIGEKIQEEYQKAVEAKKPDLQVEALRKQKESYEELAELAKKKMTFQKAAMGILGGATVLAAALALKQPPLPPVMCSSLTASTGGGGAREPTAVAKPEPTSVPNAANPTPAQPVKPVTPPSGPATPTTPGTPTPTTTTPTTVPGTATPTPVQPVTPTTPVTPATPTTPPVPGTTTPTTIPGATTPTPVQPVTPPSVPTTPVKPTPNPNYRYPGTGSATPTQVNPLVRRSLWQQGIDFFLPEAQANMALIGLGGGAALGSLRFVQGIIQKGIKTAGTRAAMWGVLAGLIALASKATDDKRKEMLNRAKILEDLIEKYSEDGYGANSEEIAYNGDSSGSRGIDGDGDGGLDGNGGDGRDGGDGNVIVDSGDGGDGGDGSGNPSDSNLRRDKKTGLSLFGDYGQRRGLNDYLFGGAPCLTRKRGRGCLKVPSPSRKQMREMAKHSAALPGLAANAARLGNSLNNSRGSISGKTFNRAKKLAGQSGRWASRAKKAKRNLFKHLRKRRGGARAVARLRKFDRNLEKKLVASTGRALKRAGLGSGSLLSPSRGSFSSGGGWKGASRLRGGRGGRGGYPGAAGVKQRGGKGSGRSGGEDFLGLDEEFDNGAGGDAGAGEELEEFADIAVDEDKDIEKKWRKRYL